MAIDGIGQKQDWKRNKKQEPVRPPHYNKSTPFLTTTTTTSSPTSTNQQHDHMEGSSGSYSVGAGSLARAEGKRKAHDVTNVEDEDVEALGDASEEVEDFTSMKRIKFGLGLKDYSELRLVKKVPINISNLAYGFPLSSSAMMRDVKNPPVNRKYIQESDPRIANAGSEVSNTESISVEPSKAENDQPTGIGASTSGALLVESSNVRYDQAALCLSQDQNEELRALAAHYASLGYDVTDPQFIPWALTIVTRSPLEEVSTTESMSVESPDTDTLLPPHDHHGDLIDQVPLTSQVNDEKLCVSMAQSSTHHGADSAGIESPNSGKDQLTTNGTLAIRTLSVESSNVQDNQATRLQSQDQNDESVAPPSPPVASLDWLSSYSTISVESSQTENEQPLENVASITQLHDHDHEPQDQDDDAMSVDSSCTENEQSAENSASISESRDYEVDAPQDDCSESVFGIDGSGSEVSDTEIVSVSAFQGSDGTGIVLEESPNAENDQTGSGASTSETPLLESSDAQEDQDQDQAALCLSQDQNEELRALAAHYASLGYDVTDPQFIPWALTIVTRSPLEEVSTTESMSVESPDTDTSLPPHDHHEDLIDQVPMPLQDLDEKLRASMAHHTSWDSTGTDAEDNQPAALCLSQDQNEELRALAAHCASQGYDVTDSQFIPWALKKLTCSLSEEGSDAESMPVESPNIDIPVSPHNQSEEDEKLRAFMAHYASQGVDVTLPDFIFWARSQGYCFQAERLSSTAANTDCSIPGTWHFETVEEQSTLLPSTEHQHRVQSVQIEEVSEVNVHRYKNNLRLDEPLLRPLTPGLPMEDHMDCSAEGDSEDHDGSEEEEEPSPIADSPNSPWPHPRPLPNEEEDVRSLKAELNSLINGPVKCPSMKKHFIDLMNLSGADSAKLEHLLDKCYKYVGTIPHTGEVPDNHGDDLFSDFGPKPKLYKRPQHRPEGRVNLAEKVRYEVAKLMKVFDSNEYREVEPASSDVDMDLTSGKKRLVTVSQIGLKLWKERLGPGPSVDDFVLQLDAGIHTPWNKAACAVFCKYFFSQEGHGGYKRDLVKKAFMARIVQLKRDFESQGQEKTTERLDEERRARRLARRSTLLHRRIRAFNIMYSTEQGPLGDLARFISYLCAECMSGDETGPDQKYIKTTVQWRSQELIDFLHLLSAFHLKLQYRGNGKYSNGVFPHARYPSTRSESVFEINAAPRCLPVNWYNPAWLAFDESRAHVLAPGPAVSLQLPDRHRG
ncbi:hypothetical protein GGU11DRAFT_749249 [Lentinula aff. detonsa]|nr:hypothetical protein GGU11DRAFT_749249 [Lentinula aff. detonsa]